MRQLSDQQLYNRTDVDLTEEHQTLINKLCIQGEIPEQCKDYHIVTEPKTSRFYYPVVTQNPQLHTTLSGRPIISSNDWSR